MISLRHLISSSPSSDVAYTFIEIIIHGWRTETTSDWWCYEADTAPWPIFLQLCLPTRFYPPACLPACLPDSISNYLHNSFPVTSLCLLLSVRSSTCLSVLIRLPILSLSTRLSPCICLYTCLAVSFCLLALLFTCLGSCLGFNPCICLPFFLLSACTTACFSTCPVAYRSISLLRCLPLWWKQRIPEVMNKGKIN